MNPLIQCMFITSFVLNRSEILGRWRLFLVSVVCESRQFNVSMTSFIAPIASSRRSTSFYSFIISHFRILMTSARYLLPFRLPRHGIRSLFLALTIWLNHKTEWRFHSAIYKLECYVWCVVPILSDTRCTYVCPCSHQWTHLGGQPLRSCTALDLLWRRLFVILQGLVRENKANWQVDVEWQKMRNGTMQYLE